MADIEVDTGNDWVIKLESTAAGDVYKIMDNNDVSMIEITASGTVTGSIILDEDAMGSDSATHICTQQSIVAYVATQLGDYIEAETGVTDNAVVRWDTTDGGLVQDSLMTVDDSGTANIPTSQHYHVNGSQHQHVEADITDLATYLENIVEDVTPQLGADLDRQEFMSLYPMSLGTDLRGSGEGVSGVTIDGSVNTVAFGTPLFYNGTDGTFYATNADDPSTMLCVGLSLHPSDITTDAPERRVLFKGTVRKDSWTWTGVAGLTGALLYIGATLSSLTITKPAGSGDIVQCVGWIIDADTIFFDPSLNYETV